MPSGARPRWARSTRPPPAAGPADPLGESVRRLGNKWTLLLLRDMAFHHRTRFSEFLRGNPGLTPRVLSRRLRELQAEGLVVRRMEGREVRYGVSPRGEDAVFILLAYLRYGQMYISSGPAGSRPS